MRSPEPPSDRIRAGALLLASGFQIAESLIPRVPLFPWLRAGLSWAVLLPFAEAFGVLPAIGLFLARNVLSVAFGAQPPTTFAISTVSGIAALLVCGPPLRLLLRRGWLGWIGAGIGLATAFNVAQLLLVAYALVGHGGYLFQAGPILAWSVCSGALTGWLAHRWFGSAASWEALRFSPAEGALPSGATGPWRTKAASWLAAALAPAFLEKPAPVVVLACACLLHAAWRHRRDLSLLLSAWPFFAFLAWFHLLETPGHVAAVPWFTREGIDSFLLHGGRLAVFILAGRRALSAVHWESALGQGAWARAIRDVLPVLPRLFQASIGAARGAWASRHDPDAPAFPRLLLDRLGGEPTRSP